MKKVLLLSGALLVFAAPATLAQVDLTWNNCVGEGIPTFIPPAAKDWNTCPVGAFPPAALYGSFKTPTAAPQFFAADIFIEYLNNTGVLSDFWHFEAGGCHAGGLALATSHTLGGCLAKTNPWAGVSNFNATGFTANDPSVGRGRIKIGMSRPAASPFPGGLVPGTNYFMFQLTISPSGCTGCGDQGGFTWIESILRQGGGLSPITIFGRDKNSDVATWNGGTGPTPTKSSTWGQLKSLYR